VEVKSPPMARIHARRAIASLINCVNFANRLIDYDCARHWSDAASVRPSRTVVR